MIYLKKYANRRLYDINRSCYITLVDLAKIVRQGNAIEVTDAKTGQDLTRSILVQIILEIEQDGHRMIPIDALRQIIIAYNSRLEPLLSRYLEKTISAFSRHHPLANHALESSLEAISKESEFSVLAPTANNAKDSQNIFLEMKEEIKTLNDRMLSLENQS